MGEQDAGGLGGYLQRLRPDTVALLIVCLVGVALCLGTGTGTDVVPVYVAYARFFGFYFMIFFLGTRFLIRWTDTWEPQGALGRGVLRFFGGRHDALASKRADWEFARGSVLFLLAISVYSNVKSRVPIINPSVHDDWVAPLDETLFFTDFVPLASWVQATPWADALLIRVYLHDYVFMALLAFLLYFHRDAARIRVLFASAAFTYLFGILVTVLMPTVGPWLANTAEWDWLAEHTMGRYQRNLFNGWYAARQAALSGGDYTARAFVGVAALPSLHVGHMALMTFIALRTPYLRWYALLMGVMTALTTVATLAFGWHYFLDAPAGALVAYGSLRLSERLRVARWTEKPTPATAPVATGDAP